MPKLDIEQINRNRRVMNNSTIDSPYVAHIEDADADYGEQLYDKLPEDLVGLLPPLAEKEE
jgi:hypothetical protein